jgi:hypothetical protein
MEHFLALEFFLESSDEEDEELDDLGLIVFGVATARREKIPKIVGFVENIIPIKWCPRQQIRHDVFTHIQHQQNRLNVSTNHYNHYKSSTFC